MKQAIIVALAIMLGFQVCLADTESRIYALGQQDEGYRLAYASKFLIPLGVVIGGIGGLVKFEKKEFIDQFGVKRIEREYNGWNYAMISTGSSCFIVGVALLVASKKERNSKISFYQSDGALILTAHWHF